MIGMLVLCRAYFDVDSLLSIRIVNHQCCYPYLSLTCKLVVVYSGMLLQYFLAKPFNYCIIASIILIGFYFYTTISITFINRFMFIRIPY